MFCLPKMYHHCTVKTEDGSIPELLMTGTFFQKLKARLRGIVLVSPDNPRASRYCRSERALRDEKQRQLNSKCPWVIHPLSKFRVCYDMYLILLYTICLVLKPIDSAFARSEEFFPGYRIVHLVLDLMCWVDIMVNFCTGFSSIKLRRIELRLGKIAKNYIRGPYFICDVLSSIPRGIPYFFFVKNRALLGVIPTLSVFKFIRLFTVVGLINRTAHYFQIRSRGFTFIITSSLVTFLVVHWLSCMQFLVPILVGTYFTNPPYRDSWIYSDGLYNKAFRLQYAHCFFKGSAEILGVRIRMYEITLIEDYLVSIFTFVIGRILLAAIWIVLAMTFLNARSMEIKFVEIVNQLDGYMAQKKLPLDFRKRIIEYYNFKFQRKYFKDATITNMLSDRLKKEVNIEICRSLLSNVPLFADLSLEETGVVVTKLTPEIFLSKDTVIYSGTLSDTLYFISSGTVAMYTHSGQEICHLQDGAYFGEMCLVVKNYSSQITVVAIEITHIYKLKKKDFEQCFVNHRNIYLKIIKNAHARIKTIMTMEEKYQNEQLKRALQITVSSLGGEESRDSLKNS